MDVGDIATVKYPKALTFFVTKENEEHPLSLLVIRRRVWTGNCRTQIMTIKLGHEDNLT